MMAQVTAAALASECKVLSHPASVDTIPTDGSKEDVVPMAMGAAWKLRRVVRNVRHVLAIELMCARAGHRLSRAAASRVAASRARTRRCARSSRRSSTIACCRADIDALADAIARRAVRSTSES